MTDLPEGLSPNDRQTRHKAKSPMQRILDTIPEGYMTHLQVAELYGVHKETIKRLGRTDKVQGPSAQKEHGQVLIEIWTPSDLEDLAQYYADRRNTYGEKE